MVGFWATLALNIPDLTRFARGPEGADARPAPRASHDHGALRLHRRRGDLGVGHRSSARRSGIRLQLLSQLRKPARHPLALFAVSVATLTTNVAANVVAPANGFAESLAGEDHLRPTAACSRASSAIVMMPWKLLEDYGTYIFGWLVGYSGFLGPIAGIFIADYLLIRGPEPLAPRPLPSRTASTSIRTA